MLLSCIMRNMSIMLINSHFCDYILYCVQVINSNNNIIILCFVI